jgi:hypothetical protein
MNQPLKPEPRWPALVAVLAVGLLYLALPDPLSPGPSWLVLVVVVILVIPTVASHRLGKVELNRNLGIILAAAITGALVWSVGALLAALPSHRDTPLTLLKAAAALWACNILVFATWYWRLDAGGPHKRDKRGAHVEGAFLFPQMTMHDRELRGWRPGFVDYLFLAFNTSTAFSPTDVPPLTRWAKLLMMVQSILSLTTIAVLAARAVNIL